MIKAAFSAGKILKKYYGRKLNIKDKAGKGLVSQADKEAENKILSILLRKFNFNVIAEESDYPDNNSEYCWVIDPIDGTTNYLHQIPFFCISIALYKDDKPEAAVIYQPLSKELFYAEHGKGVCINGKKLGKLNTNTPAIIDCNLGYSDESARLFLEALNGILPQYHNIRNLGSSALELAYLAASRLDCFLSYGDELYDVAAGILMAQESGCLVTNWEGIPWNIKDKSLLVAPPELHGKIRKIFVSDF